MNFLQDYWAYHSCYEIPRNYALWSGIGLLASVVHKKAVYFHGDLEMRAPMYIGLIGPQGSSKSTCCSFAKGFFREACPELRVGPSRASPESLCKMMCEPDFARVFTNHLGEPTEVRPLMLFINEFKNFVGRSPFDMLTFLTDIYDVPGYDASTIARGLEWIMNPAINILCCETPEWIIRNIKGDIISGGFGRRIVYVYELDDLEDDKPLPLITATAREAINRCKERLLQVRGLNGHYKWSPGGFRFYDKWYKDNAKRRRAESNPMMKGYLKTKHVQLFKVMMCVDSSLDTPSSEFGAELLDECLSYLDIVEPNMLKLWFASGRNELLYVQRQIVDILNGFGNWVEENMLKRTIEAELNPTEIYSVLRHLEDTEQVIKREVEFPKRGRKWGYTTPEVYNRLKKKDEDKPRDGEGTTPDVQPPS